MPSADPTLDRLFGGDPAADPAEDCAEDPSDVSFPSASAGRGPASPERPPGLVSPRVTAPPQDLGLVGRGGMGEVRRLRDPALGRTYVRKAVRPDRWSEELEARLVQEARIMARLDHPGVVPIFALEEDVSGRRAFSMREVRGERFDARIRAAWERRPDRLPGRLLDELGRVAETLAYAHNRGVIHRDVKPQNIMVGRRGEVLLLDWGLATIDEEGIELHTAELEVDPLETRFGSTLGTPAWAAPEQLDPTLGAVGPAADVFALGAVLFNILAGRPPFAAGRRPTDLAPPLEAPFPIPEDLHDIVATALSLEPDARYADAEGLRSALLDWRDGEGRRARAQRDLRLATTAEEDGAAILAEAAVHRARAAALLSGVQAADPLSAKAPGWAEEDAARRLEEAAEVALARVVPHLQAALVHDPDAVEAHARLADHYQARHAAAEGRGDHPEALRLEALLRAHDRGRHRVWLEGGAELSLTTEPADAVITLYRYVEQDRLLRPVFERRFGAGPLVREPLPRGSYLLLLEAPGHHPTRYPVSLDRGEHHDGRDDRGAVRPVRLPPLGTLGLNDCYVPAGWFYQGGDELAISGLPARRRWLEGFILQRENVTQAEYLSYLNRLRQEVGEEAALVAAPRPIAAREGEESPVVYGRDPAGDFILVPDAEGDLWDLDWAVIYVSWDHVQAYAVDLARRTGLPWRLPRELEREKAGRGADRRPYPWGHHLDPAFCSMDGSQAGRPLPLPVAAYPTDESPFGVHGLGGGYRDWLADAWGRLEPPQDLALDQPRMRVSRGGSWLGDRRWSRVCSRGWIDPRHRTVDISFRLARSWPPPPAPEGLADLGQAG